MNTSDWIQVSLVIVGTMSILMTIVIYLHSRRTTAIERLDARIGDVELRLNDRFIKISTSATAQHEAISRAISDLAATVANNYVRRIDLDSAMRTISEGITESRKDIGKVHERVDDLFRDLLGRDKLARRN